MTLQYKAPTKKESEIKMTNSQRLAANGSIVKTEEPKPFVHEDGAKEKVIGALFILASIVLMYWSMNPARKV